MFQNKVADKDYYNNMIKGLELSFKHDFNLIPCVGAELEFYLLNLKSESQLLHLEQKCNIKIKIERGDGQYEIEFSPSIKVASYPNIIAKTKMLIELEARHMGLKADFSAKPFPNDFGNSMHIHFNFLNDLNAEKYAQILCHYLPETIDAFLPNKKDYDRLDHKFMAPTHISYGGNNRTTLIRIPDSYPRRLEHRLASADADPHKVIYAILFAIYHGLKYPQNIKKLDKIHGNAYDDQYHLVKIKPRSSLGPSI